ncbi:MAG: peptidoglycan-binding protein [Thermoanaerobacteraceae bacterium]|nr:peptidoglycan-binding protein [Thermoanaerobacteraceae bacterium]
MLRYTLTILSLFLFGLGHPLPAPAGEHRCGENEPVQLTAPFHRGRDIANLQQCLSVIGYFQGKNSGYYDQPTMRAVSRFQRDHGLAPTGVVDQATWQALSLAMIARAVPEAAPSPHHDLFILVNTENLTLTVFSRGQPVRQYPVALGRPGAETPTGLWKVMDKSAEYVPGMGPRWMGLNIPSGSFGIHGTDSPWSIGTFASAGCVRLHNAHVLELYDWVSEGTPVLILGNPLKNGYPVLYSGSCGSVVQEVQRTLHRLGYYEDKPDGVFGPGTARAVSRFREEHGLSPAAVVDEPVYRLLGL